MWACSALSSRWGDTYAGSDPRCAASRCSVRWSFSRCFRSADRGARKGRVNAQRTSLARIRDGARRAREKDERASEHGARAPRRSQSPRQAARCHRAHGEVRSTGSSRRVSHDEVNHSSDLQKSEREPPKRTRPPAPPHRDLQAGPSLFGGKYCSLRAVRRSAGRAVQIPASAGPEGDKGLVHRLDELHEKIERSRCNWFGWKTA